MCVCVCVCVCVSVGARGCVHRVDHGCTHLCSYAWQGPFDMVFDHVFSPNFPLKRVHDFARSTPEVLFKHAVFVHPGYTNWLFVQLFEKGSCERSLQMLQSFREFFLDGMKIETKFKVPCARLLPHVT